MNIKEIRMSRSFMLVCGLALVLAGTQLAMGQGSAQTTTRERTTNTRPVPSGAKMKFKGVVIRRDEDTFTIRDRSRVDYQVLLTDNTSIKTYGGFLRSGKKYAVTDILRGLIVEVEGRGDAEGQLVAEKVRFNESDLRAAITTDTRVGVWQGRWMSYRRSRLRPEMKRARQTSAFPLSMIMMCKKLL